MIVTSTFIRVIGEISQVSFRLINLISGKLWRAPNNGSVLKFLVEDAIEFFFLFRSSFRKGIFIGSLNHQ